MAILTPARIDNRLGTIASTPAATVNAGPVAGDIGADASTPTPAILCRIFDLTVTANQGDTCTLTIPDSIQRLSQLTPGLVAAGLGLDIGIVPKNAAAVAGAPSVAQTATQVVLTFTGATLAGGGAVGAGVASEFFGYASNGSGGNPPNDYAATIAINAAMDFPNAGPTTGAGAPTRQSAGVFLINTAGLYSISYQASFTEPGQVAIRTNAASVAANPTRAGRATGTSQIADTVLLQLAAGDTVGLFNDQSAAALTVTPIAGGTQAVAANIVFRLISAGSGGVATAAIYQVVIDGRHTIGR